MSGQERAGADISYSAALAELNTILAELEGNAVDVDRLATQVARAALLIRVCRERITAARMEVDLVVAHLDDNGDADGD